MIDAKSPEDLQAAIELIEEFERSKGSGATAARWIAATLGEVAEFFGVEAQTVREWRTGAKPMPGSEGTWDLSAIAQWRCNRLKSLGANAKSQEEIDLDMAIKREDHKKRLLANQIKAKTVADRATMIGKVAEMNNEARMLIEAIPDNLSPLLPPEIRSEGTAKIRQDIALILKKMAQKAEGCGE